MFDGLVLTLAAALQSAVQAPPPSPEGPRIVVEGERPDKDKKVCRKGPPPTGSRLGGRRICRTKLEWTMSEEAARRVLEAHSQRERAMRAHEQNQKNGLADKVTP